MLKLFIKKIFAYLRQIRIIYKYNGATKTLKYLCNFFSSERDLLIYDYQTKIRTKSPDFKVALESLGSEFDILFDFLKQDFDGLIVDGGGYIGTAAMKLARRYPSAKIISIEPSLENYKILKFNIQNFKNITSINAALTVNNSDEIKIYDRKTGQWGYSIIENSSQDVIGVSKTITLSQILDNNLVKGVIKLDVEGYEYFLLNDDQENLNQFNVIIIELHERIFEGIEKSFNRFNHNNFRLHFRTSGEKFISVRKDYICK